MRTAVEAGDLAVNGCEKSDSGRPVPLSAREPSGRLIVDAVMDFVARWLGVPPGKSQPHVRGGAGYFTALGELSTSLRSGHPVVWDHTRAAFHPDIGRYNADRYNEEH